MNALVLLVALAAADSGYKKLPEDACPGRGQFRDDHFQKLGPLPECPGSEDGSIFPRLLRGGAPNRKGLRCLKEQGVTAVIDLRSRGEEGQKEEEKAAAELGLEYFNFPMTTYGGLEKCEKDFTEKTEKNRTATERAKEKIIELHKSSPSARIYVHCAHGQDRTGLFLGLLRMELDQCSPSVTRAEMTRYKYSPYCSLEEVWKERSPLPSEAGACGNSCSKKSPPLIPGLGEKP